MSSTVIKLKTDNNTWNNCQTATCS